MKKEKLLIVGAGSFAAEIEELSILCGYNEVAFLDDNVSTAKCSPVIGTIDAAESFLMKYKNAIVAIGNNHTRRVLISKLEEIGFNIPILIHPTAYISPDAIIFKGCIVRNNGVVGRYARLEQGTIINIGAIVDHDCIIGEASHVLPGAVIRNSVKISSESWVEANSVIQ